MRAQFTLVVALLLLSPACKSRNSDAPAAGPPQVQTDLSALRRIAALPEGSFACRFVVDVRGTQSRSAPGPTDYLAYVYVELDGVAWDSLPAAALPGAPVMFPKRIAEALLPTVIQNKGSVSADAIQFPGAKIAPDSLGRMPYRAGSVARVEDALIMVLYTS